MTSKSPGTSSGTSSKDYSIILRFVYEEEGGGGGGAEKSPEPPSTFPGNIYY